MTLMVSHERRLAAQDTVDQHLRDAQLPPVMQAQFGGTLATRIICRGVPYRSEKDEDFVQVTHLSQSVWAMRMVEACLQPCRPELRSHLAASLLSERAVLVANVEF